MWSGSEDLLLGGEGTGGNGGSGWLIVPVGSGGGEANVSSGEGGELELWVGSVGKESIGGGEPLLGLVIKDLLLNEDVEWSGTVIDSGENEIVLNIGTGDHVEVHAGTWLHGGGDWLSEILDSVWDLVALNNINIEINIRVEGDWLSANSWPGVSITVGEVVWAVNLGSVSLSKLEKSEIPALEDLGGTESEDLWSSISLIVGISNNSSILEGTSPVDGGPVSVRALISGSVLVDINTNLGNVVTGISVRVVVSVGTIDIWAGSLLDGRDTSGEGSDS